MNNYYFANIRETRLDSIKQKPQFAYNLPIILLMHISVYSRVYCQIRLYSTNQSFRK